LAAKDGRIFFHKTYGFHTYDSINPVTENDLYDFASVTKITASLPCIMKLTDEEEIKPDAKFAVYWPDFKHSNKKNLILRDVLAHQAGLVSGISFWKKTLKKNGKFKHRLIRSDSSEKFPVRITDSIFLRRNYNQKIYKSIKKSKLLKEKKYVYSDLSFILYPEIVKRLTYKNFEDYLQENFYKPLGANTLGKS
jgi:CubicO group peptidase (beta-lactamase class C family)